MRGVTSCGNTWRLWKWDNLLHRMLEESTPDGVWIFYKEDFIISPKGESQAYSEIFS